MLPRAPVSLACLVLLGCTSHSEGETPWPRATAPYLLARHPDDVTAIEVPPDSRGGVPPSEEVPVQGPFELRRTVKGVHTFDAPLPVRPRVLFFTSAPKNMTVRAGDRRLRFKRGSRAARRKRSWCFSQDTLTVRLERDKPPEPGEIVVSYPRAVDRERSLNRRWAEAESDRAFVFRSLQQDETTRTGVLLPAPASVTWELEIPPSGRLALDAGILEPETADLEPRDAASLVVTLEQGGTEHPLLSAPLPRGEFEHLSTDLSPWAGQRVALTLSSDPGEDPTQDYVFAAEPRVYTPVKDPPRIVLFFVDTVRSDHLGLYGYERDTTPLTDAWAEQAVVFEQMRAAAPWTLPSVRAFLTGDAPEYWGSRVTLPQRLAAAGWITGAFTGNVYLSTNFDMSDHWSEYFVENWPRAESQMDRAMAWLEEQPDVPVFLMIHFMDPHLPYTEPAAYRYLFTGAPLDDLGESFQRSTVIRAVRKHGDEARDHVVGRYDGSLRYVDDQIHRLIPDLDEDDTVIVFSDHGEEFWDHGGFEHGHTLYDELLRVPFVLRAPGIEPGRVDTPTNLVDLFPTVLELAGLEPDPPTSPRHGRSLVPLMQGEKAGFEDRPQSFGRPLYGDERWGALAGSRKYLSRKGEEALYDLAEDPGEKNDLFADLDGEGRGATRSTLADALDWPVHVAFRLRPSRGTSGLDLEAHLEVPGGIAAAWAGADPTDKSEAEVEVDGNVAHITWKKGHTGRREVFVAPLEPAFQAARGLRMTVKRGTTEQTVGPPEAEELPPPDGHHHRLLNARAGGKSVAVTYAVVPEMPEDAGEVDGYDEEVEGALRALGYLE